MAEKKHTWLKKGTIFLLVLSLVTIGHGVYSYRKQIKACHKTIKTMIEDVKLVKKQNKQIKEELTKFHNALHNCDTEYKKLKIGCRKMHSQCLSMIRECDDIIENKKNCRAVRTLRRCL
mgnify:CR=1 FL=1|tara:strand:+ start:3671 stop:4027 length:357 start_codon:yes stop_codon:yes gene_type:complete